MFNWLKTNQALIWIFIAALLVRFLFLAVFYPSYEGRFLEGDSIDYIVLARNIITHQTLSLDTEPPIRPIVSYTPGYPIFSIAFSFGTLNILSILVAQNIIGALAAVFIFLLSKNITENKTFSYMAAGLYIAEPGMLFYTSQILTETLFLFLFTLALWLLWKWRHSRSGLNLAAIGLSLGLATYVRPTGQHLLVFFLIYLAAVFIKEKKIFSKTALVSLLTPALVFLIVLGPWLVRNSALTGHYQISSFGSYVLASRTLPSYYAWRTGISMTEAQLLTNKILDDRGIRAEALSEYDIYSDPNINKETLKIIAEDPAGFFGSQTRFLMPYFFGTGWSEIVKVFRGDETNPPYFISRLDSSILERANFLSVLGAGFFGILYILSFFGVIKIWQEKNNRLFLVFIILIIAYFAFSTGELSYSRYRYPVNPLIFVLASAGVIFLWDHLRSREARFPEQSS